MRDDGQIHDNFDNFLSDLGVISIWTTLTIISVITPFTFVRTVLAIPAILFIPGYVLMAALFPKKDDIDKVARVALSFGISIVVILLLGLLLNFTFGIKLIPILSILYLYTIILVLISSYRRKKLPKDVQFSVQLDRIYKIANSELKPKSRTDLILTIMLIFGILSTIGTIYFTITTPKIGERFTEFYVLNSSMGTDYPTNIKLNPSITLFIGVTNHEYLPTNYTVQVLQNQEMLASEDLTLNNDETWKGDVTITPSKDNNTNVELKFLLFKDNNFTVPYRSLHLWMI